MALRWPRWLARESRSTAASCQTMLVALLSVAVLSVAELVINGADVERMVG
jgi:hypothetical protein